jgi:hypothetical protein
MLNPARAAIHGSKMARVANHGGLRPVSLHHGFKRVANKCLLEAVAAHHKVTASSRVLKKMVSSRVHLRKAASNKALHRPMVRPNGVLSRKAADRLKSRVKNGRRSTHGVPLQSVSTLPRS